MSKENEVMAFLHEHVFDRILNSDSASQSLKKGVRYTTICLGQRDARGMIPYYWSAISGTEKRTEFARQMKDEGFTRFEEVTDEFRDRFTCEWLLTWFGQCWQPA